MKKGGKEVSRGTTLPISEQSRGGEKEAKRKKKKKNLERRYTSSKVSPTFFPCI